MIVNNEDFKQKLNYLGMAISKNVASKMTEQSIRFESSGNTVYGYTTDGINNIRVEIGNSDEDFYVIVNYKSFTDFINSCEGDITLEPKSKFINIKASNVKCKLPTYNHEVQRNLTGIPDPTNSNYTYDNELTEEIELNVLKSVLNPNFEVTIYQNIYFGDNIMVSDTDNVLIIEKNVFNKNILLQLSSVSILNNITNIKYNFVTEDGIEKMIVQSDELYAKIVLIDNSNDDFQYDDFMELFNEVGGSSVDIDIDQLTKAMHTASMFKIQPYLVFNKKGIFLRIESIDFVYKISSESCDDHMYELTSNVVRNIHALGKQVKVYYTNENLIKCEVDNKKEILSINEVNDYEA